MIALFGALANPSIAYLCRRLVEDGAEPFLFDARQYPALFDPRWSWRGGRLEGTLRWGERSVPLDAISAVYVHQVDLALGAPSTRAWDLRRAAGHEAMAALLGALPCLVVNRPDLCWSNRSKPLQQRLVEAHGFRAPRTLVTTSPAEARRFYEELGGRVVYKPLGAQRARVQRVEPGDLARLDDVRVCPTMFQELVPGTDLRVHVVGDELFAARIEGDALDYRYAGHDASGPPMRPVALDPALADRCVALSRGLGMVVSGIDLRETKEGERVCFEVNPAPGFAYYQAITGQPIGEAIMRLLRAGDAERAGRVTRP